MHLTWWSPVCSDYCNLTLVTVTGTVNRVGYRHTREEILDGALRAAIDEGLSQLTFGRLAKRMGISDRIVVYYFPTKPDLIREVVVAMGVQLQRTLAAAFATPARNHVELVARAWPLLAKPGTDRIFALFFEANGLAAVGREPYASVVPALVEGWIDWAANLIAETNPHRRTEAETSIAIIDGLLLLRLLGGPAAANRAAATFIDAR